MVVGVRRASPHGLFRSALIPLFIVFFASGALWAGGGPRNVVVVINVSSPESREIGLYYKQVRGIPDSNICYINCSSAELVGWQEFETRIREPIRQFLMRPQLAGNIDYIVLTKGIPLKVDYGRPSSSGPYSSASILTAVDHPDIQEYFPFPYGPIAASRWTTAAPEIAWSHNLTFIDKNNGRPYRFYLVTRLDAFTVDQVKAMISRASRPALDGAFVLDRVQASGQYNTGEYRKANLRLGTPTASAYDLLVKNGFEVRFDGGLDFLANQRGVMGYFSWATHDVGYTFQKYVSNVFVPGSIADSYWSYSGSTFTDPQSTNRPPLMADLFACGLCGAGAYVSEPYVNNATRPEILFDRYTKGYNMAESFYAACPLGFWKTVVVGDPLMAPYATPPEVTISVDSTTLSGVEEITAIANDEAGIAKVVFYLDDIKIGEVYSPPFTITIDTNEYSIGPHTIEAIAYENSPVGTQGSAKLQVSIDNVVSTVNTIHEARVYPGGQWVKVRAKVVTATPNEIGDGFYIQELDRASAIKVMSTEPVQRGDLVTVKGQVYTVCGERVLTNAVVESRTSGGAEPRPLMVRLCDLGGAKVGDFTSPIGRGSGARNTSLLVRVVGKVTSVEAGAFYLTDGSTLVPIKVRLPVGAQAPTVGSWTTVTGISAAEEVEGGIYQPYIIARNAADIQPL